MVSDRDNNPRSFPFYLCTHLKVIWHCLSSFVALFISTSFKMWQQSLSIITPLFFKYQPETLSRQLVIRLTLTGWQMSQLSFLSSFALESVHAQLPRERSRVFGMRKKCLCYTVSRSGSIWQSSFESLTCKSVWTVYQDMVQYVGNMTSMCWILQRKFPVSVQFVIH